MDGDPFQRFRATCQLHRVNVAASGPERTWSYFDQGPKELAPLVCVGGVAGTAEVFYNQVMSLSSRGYRVVAARWPEVESHKEWVHSFDLFLDTVQNASKVHLYGSSLGGFLVQLYAASHPNRVSSLVLTNTFTTTRYFSENAGGAGLYGIMPSFLLKRTVLQNFPDGTLEAGIAHSVDFMVNQVEKQSRNDLIGSLNLSTWLSEVPKDGVKVPQGAVTIMDTNDEAALHTTMKEEMTARYPDAKIGLLKSGGNFPYLSRPDEVNMHLQVHLRNNGVTPVMHQ